MSPGRYIEKTDDDGEGGGSRRILTEMQRLDCKDACVVVSRWYGGQNLGGARFRHIVSTARGVLSRLGYGEKAVEDSSESGSSSDDDEAAAGEDGGSGRKRKARGRTFFDRTGVVSQGGEARRPSGVDKQLWHKMLQSLRGAARPARRLANAAAAASGGADGGGGGGSGDGAAPSWAATAAAAASGNTNGLLAGLAAFGSGGDVDPETTEALRRLPPKTQLKLVRELQKSHERDAHQKFVTASKHNEADIHAPGAGMSDVSSLQLASYLQKAALKRREVAALTQLNNASQSDVELPRALTAAASGTGGAPVPQNGAW